LLGLGPPDRGFEDAAQDRHIQEALDVGVEHRDAGEVEDVVEDDRAGAHSGPSFRLKSRRIWIWKTHQVRRVAGLLAGDGDEAQEAGDRASDVQAQDEPAWRICPQGWEKCATRNHGPMRAMVLERAGEPLRLADLPRPEPEPGQVLIAVRACGVCRTDLHILDGELTEPKLPLVPGHQIVGNIAGAGEGAERFEPGQRVGVPWLGWTDGSCRYCASGRENLCDEARFTGYDLDGGYAEYAVADERFCFPLPDGYPDIQAAPLLCAGLIGYRALRLVGDAERIGFYGFGASAHILCQVAVHQGRRVFAFTREGDEETQAFARSLGAEWAGASTEAPPEELDGAIVFAAAGPLMPAALRVSAKGARVISAGIHMSEIPAFPYEILWEERTLGSVANLTRADGDEFLALAPQVPVRTEVTTYPLERANEALEDLRAGAFRGAAVLEIGV
jgi:alcohol dehydrogenase, propanol-preferring